MPKAAVLIGIFFLLLTLLIHPAHAAGEFKTSYNTTYTVEEDSRVKVTQNITSENLTSEYRLSEYKFTIGSELPANITAWDPAGPITPKITKESGSTVVEIKFRAVIVGKGSKLNFGISYAFPGLAGKNGLIWELNLLKITGLEEIYSYNLTVSVPTSFGPPLFQFPTPVSQKIVGERRLITYNKAGLSQGAPRLGFGESQLYQLKLTYHLENPRVGLGYTEIALPPDIIGYQQLVQESLLPAPIFIRVDGDGNYLARYDLRPLEKKDVVWEGWVALYYPPRDFSTGKLSDIPEELVQKYTVNQKYWETGAVEIISEAAKLADPGRPVAEMMRQIYNFVTGKLSYDYQKLESGELVRLGALAALAQPDKAVCMEYTDLFIALVRAAGIPAREVDGFAYTADDTNRPLSLRLEGDVLHAWPQAYFPGTGWMMVDPTWGSTSESDYFSFFDLSHIAFVVKGESSEYPLPAGSYKTNPNQKDVEVSFSTQKEVTQEDPQLNLELKLAKFILSPLSSTAEITVTNTGKATAFETEIKLESNLLKLEDGTLDVGTLPPGASVSHAIQLISTSPWTKGEEKIKATATAQAFDGGKNRVEQEDTETVRPIYWPLQIREWGLVAAFSLIIIFSRKIFLDRITKS